MTDEELIAALRALPRCQCATTPDEPNAPELAADRLEALTGKPRAGVTDADIISMQAMRAALEVALSSGGVRVREAQEMLTEIIDQMKFSRLTNGTKYPRTGLGKEGCAMVADALEKVSDALSAIEPTQAQGVATDAEDAQVQSVPTPAELEPDHWHGTTTYVRLDTAQAALAALRAERERLERERDEALDAPWPKWAEQLRLYLQGFGVDPGDEWDLPEQYEDWLNEVVRIETEKAEARYTNAREPGEFDDGVTVAVDPERD